MRWIFLIVQHDVLFHFLGSRYFLGVAFTTPLKVVEALRVGQRVGSTSAV